jgi:hypothetical protein
MVRQFAITNIFDGMIEIITNNMDAYAQTSVTEKKININITNDGQNVSVTDNAIGLYGQKMEDCFLQVGKYTAETGSRGFFSRGSSDICVLGNITFEAIKEGKHSICYLNTDAQGKMVQIDETVTEATRTRLGIPVNGLSVSISLLDTYIISDISRFYCGIQKNMYLRDIVSDPNVNMVLCSIMTNSVNDFQKRVTYTYPEPYTTVLDVDYTVPGYTGITAKFVVKRTDKFAGDTNINKNEREYGFLVKADNAIYDNLLLLENVPDIGRYYGYIYCDYIDTLIKSYDTDGPTTENPHTIVDPSRKGVSLTHPFVKALLSVATNKFRIVTDSFSNQDDMISLNVTDISEILDELGAMGLDFSSNETQNVEFQSNDSKNIVAINDRNVINELMTIEIEEDDPELIDKLIAMAEELRLREGIDETQKVYILHINEKYGVTGSRGGGGGGAYDDPFEPPEEPPIVTRMKTYKFVRGEVVEPEDQNPNYQRKKNKSLTFTLIYQPQLKRRYLIDINNKADIKINIGDPLVRKHLSPETLNLAAEPGEAPDTSMSLQKIKNISSLTYLQDLLIEIFTDMVVENDVRVGKISHAENTPAAEIIRNTMKYRAHILNRIEGPIDKYFESRFAGITEETTNNIITVVKATDDIDGSYDDITALVK